jgi:hypothetical protein
MTPHPALRAARLLREGLEEEYQRARSQSEALKAMDASRLLELAQAREQFAAVGCRLEQELAGHSAEPGQDPALDAEFASIRTLAREIKGLDDLNRQVAGASHQVVAAWLGALRPPARGYDRQGARAQDTLSTVSTRY